MTDLASGPSGATPVTDAERRGLLQPVLTRAELNLAEAANINAAMSWLFLSRRRIRPESVTGEQWLQRLHREMYGQVWAWAGRYRTADRNLGVPHWQIRMDMRGILADARAWLADTTRARACLTWSLITDDSGGSDARIIRDHETLAGCGGSAAAVVAVRLLWWQCGCCGGSAAAVVAQRRDSGMLNASQTARQTIFASVPSASAWLTVLLPREAST